MIIGVVTEGDPDRTSGGSLYHRRIAELAPAHGHHVTFHSVPSRPGPLALPAGPRVLRAAAAGSDVLVIDSLASNTLGVALRVGRAAHPPIVGSIHQVLGGSDGDRWWRRLRARNDRWTWAAATRCAVASQHLRDALVAAGVPRDRLVVVPPGHDLEAPASGPLPDLRGAHRMAILCVANWLPRKGILELVEAVAALPPGTAVLHLVGDERADDDYRARVLDRLADPDVRDHVVRHGVVRRSSIGALYGAADVFALASTVEPYGIVYGEAMAAGLPVVGWDAGNLPNLVADGVEGRLVPSGDVGALTAALAELERDLALRAVLGKAAGARAESLPTWEDTAARFLAVCEEAARANQVLC
jgi:glycosyltransferase involved in cell wall biosynthesis